MGREGRQAEGLKEEGVHSRVKPRFCAVLLAWSLNQCLFPGIFSGKLIPGNAGNLKTLFICEQYVCQIHISAEFLAG